MNTYFRTLRAHERRRWRRQRVDASSRITATDCRRKTWHRVGASEDGFLLIEVLVSALLVALIVSATFTGFDVTNRLSADERHHNVAAVLAAQSQEQLRSDPATTLDVLETNPHTYTRTIPAGGTVYTITQEAKPVSASGETTGCSFSEKGAQSGANIQVSSTVTWPQLSKAERPAVKQVSVITPPVGSALEVDVNNGGSPAAGVSGVTAIARFTPVESGAPTTAEGTTGTAGCIVLTGLAATTTSVEVLEKPGFVTPNGALKWPLQEELTITPNLTTHYEVTLNEAGRIQAEYTYKGATVWETKPVTGDTFTAYNAKIPKTPQFIVGNIDKGIEYAASGEEPYKVMTTGKYATVASTPAGTKYTKGDLFPFPVPWSVSAGDCHKNGTASIAEAIAEGTVLPGKTTTVKVPLSIVNLNVYAGTQTTPGALSSTAYEATILDSECSSELAPNNSTAANLLHTQKTTTTGHLENPFQPFGKATLCVYNSAAKKTYEVSYSNLTATGSSPNIYIGEPSEAERAEKKKAAETVEATERATWKSEYEKGKISKATYETKLTEQTTKRNEREAKEKAELPASKENLIESGQSSC
jgi:Tfp pilus assembly protein PilV